MRDTPLDNGKHEHFCQLVANGESATQAYVLAGYSEKGAAASASRLLKAAEICERLAFLRSLKEKQHAEAVNAVIERHALTKDWVIQQLMENVDMAKQATPVLDRQGNPTGLYEQNLAAANRALELLGTELGMFIKKAEVGKPGDFQELSDAELERQRVELERELGIGSGAVH